MAAANSRTLSRRSSRRSAPGKGRRGRRFTSWLLGILAALLLLLVVGYYQALAYLQSESFRSLLQEKLSNKGKTEKVILASTLDIDGSRLSLAGGEMQRRDACRSIRVENISADLQRQRLWDGCLAFSKINAESVSILVNLLKPASPPSPPGPAASGSKALPAQPGVGKPNRFEIGEVECRDTNLQLNRGDASLLYLQHCAVKAEPARAGDWRAWNIQLSGGKASTGFPLLREFGVKHASAAIDEQRVRVRRCALQLTPGVGELRAAGDYNLKTKAWQAQLEVTKADLDMLLTETWRRRVKGTLFANLSLSGEASRIDSGRGDISLSDALIEGLPILSDLPIGDTTPYRSIELETAECAIIFPFSEPQHNIRNAWLFDRIDVKAKGDKLRLTGRVLVGEDRQLAGTLRVGLPDAAVAALEAVNPSIVQKIFNAQGETGFRWLTLNLSGTLDNPVEDLSARLRAELLATLPETAGKAAQQAVRSLGGALSDMIRQGSSAEASPGQPAQQAGESAPSPSAGTGNAPRDLPAELIDSAADTAAESLQRGLQRLLH